MNSAIQGTTGGHRGKPTVDWEARPILSRPLGQGSNVQRLNHGKLKAPFPYFGGKSRVASAIWARLGDVDNFVEPFCGSAAVLLARPSEPRIETINDADCHVANFWRATQFAPEEVAYWADWPVNEADMHAAHRWLVLGEDADEFRKKMRSDPDFYDAKRAGRWCWGACCWIGSGWCSDAELRTDGLPREKLPNDCYRGVVQNKDIQEKRPQLCVGNTSHGPGVRRMATDVPQKRPILAAPENDSGRRSHHGIGVNAKGPSDSHRPQLADAFARGRGVHGNDDAGTCEKRREWLIDWFQRLRDRFRTVRVCCGDWSRVCNSESVTTRLGLTGIFFDPPYSAEAGRCNTLYGVESKTVAHDVRVYCLERGRDPLMRIVLAGYAGEGHEELEQHGWTVVAWSATGGYGNRSQKGKDNAKRERLWCSPFCLDPTKGSMPLFAGLEDH